MTGDGHEDEAAGPPWQVVGHVPNPSAIAREKPGETDRDATFAISFLENCGFHSACQIKKKHSIAMLLCNFDAVGRWTLSSSARGE